MNLSNAPHRHSSFKSTDQWSDFLCLTGSAVPDLMGVLTGHVESMAHLQLQQSSVKHLLKHSLSSHRDQRFSNHVGFSGNKPQFICDTSSQRMVVCFVSKCQPYLARAGEDILIRSDWGQTAVSSRQVSHTLKSSACSTVTGRMNIMLCWKRLESSDWKHKEVIAFLIHMHTINSHVGIQWSRPLLAIRKSAGLRHFRIGFSSQISKLCSY